MMKLALCLFKYFPYGGLQRDFLRIASLLLEKHHEVHVYTMSWQGDAIPGLIIHKIPVHHWQNHSRAWHFSLQVKKHLDYEHFDLVIGFNKMPHLDVYYAADGCYKSRVFEERSFWYRLTSRYRYYHHLEAAVFAPHVRTQILLLSAVEKNYYQSCYQTEGNRFHLLPPGILKDRIRTVTADNIRHEQREKLKISSEQKILLSIGSGFKTKGLDRSILAFAALPTHLREQCQFFVIGQDDASSFYPLIKKLKLTHAIHFLGGRDDVPQWLVAADILLHPAYYENTGTVILEALVSGLPVLTTEAPGYAHYVKAANMGEVISLPFSQEKLNIALEKLLVSQENFVENSKIFAKNADIYDLHEHAVKKIELWGAGRALFTS